MSKRKNNQIKTTTIVEMRVHMDCPGCERKIKKSLRKLKGVDSVDIDMTMQKVCVTGWMDQKKVLETVQKTGRLFELWPFPPNPELHAFDYSYYDQLHQTPAASSTWSHHHYAMQPDTYYSDHRDDCLSSYSYDIHHYTGKEHEYIHHYTGKEHEYYHETPSTEMYRENVTAMFSDENAHGCAVM